MREGLAERRPLNSHQHISPVDPASNFRNNCDSTSHSLAFLTSKVGSWYLTGVPGVVTRLRGTRCLPGVTEQPQVQPSMPASITLESEPQACKHFENRDQAFRLCLQCLNPAPQA